MLDGCSTGARRDGNSTDARLLLDGTGARRMLDGCSMFARRMLDVCSMFARFLRAAGFCGQNACLIPASQKCRSRKFPPFVCHAALAATRRFLSSSVALLLLLPAASAVCLLRCSCCFLLTPLHAVARWLRSAAGRRLCPSPWESRQHQLALQTWRRASWTGCPPLSLRLPARSKTLLTSGAWEPRTEQVAQAAMSSAIAFRSGMHAFVSATSPNRRAGELVACHASRS